MSLLKLQSSVLLMCFSNPLFSTEKFCISFLTQRLEDSDLYFVSQNNIWTQDANYFPTQNLSVTKVRKSFCNLGEYHLTTLSGNLLPKVCMLETNQTTKKVSCDASLCVAYRKKIKPIIFQAMTWFCLSTQFSRKGFHESNQLSLSQLRNKQKA